MFCETNHSLKQSISNWGKLLISKGGSFKPDKCFYYIVSFGWNVDGEVAYMDHHEENEFSYMCQCLMEWLIYLWTKQGTLWEYIPVQQVVEINR